MATAWEDSLMTDAPLMNSISTADLICGLAMSLEFLLFVSQAPDSIC